MRRTCKLLMAIFLGVNLIFAGGCFFTSSQGSGDDNIEASDFTLDPAKEYKIEFMMWGAKDEVDNYTALIDKFMDENENVTVSITTQDSTQYMKHAHGEAFGNHARPFLSSRIRIPSLGGFGTASFHQQRVYGSGIFLPLVNGGGLVLV